MKTIIALMILIRAFSAVALAFRKSGDGPCSSQRVGVAHSSADVVVMQTAVKVVWMTKYGAGTK
uniref:U20-Sparatoxin-Hju1n_1 n=1 Tax=Heteropoda jugulans TaxID=1358901 RepID=A0A4V2H9G1_9ARAC